MLFKISPSGSLESIPSNWAPLELELERYLITRAEADAQIQVLTADVFGEDLLLVSNQVRTRSKKRADILALDQRGNGGIIELKRDKGQLGVETQALQYLADFSSYRGRDFIRKFSVVPGVSDETVSAFLGGNARLEEINLRSRVILIARKFDRAIFSIGEWLSSKGVAFRCISYWPCQIGDAQFLSFSVEFDRTPEALYPLTFGPAAREPGIYWHNIARPNQSWWKFLVSHRQIPACFENAPGDQGERVLSKYVAKDRVVAYAAGFGAVGWGIIEDPSTYHLVTVGDEDDVLGGECRHRISLEWKATAHTLSDGLSAEEIRREFNIYHPISTSVSINKSDGEKLLVRLSDHLRRSNS
jgi:hypothetical protein